MDIKLDVNKLVDKLANAERTVGEQGKAIADMEKTIVALQEEKRAFERKAHDIKHDFELLKKECDDLQESVSFWYGKAIELGYKFDWSENLESAKENEDFAHGA